MSGLRLVLASSIGLVLVALLVVKLVYGGGAPFPDRSTPPAVPRVKVAATLALPPGCITIAPSGRVFFDTHPFSAPGRFDAPHVFEWVNGEGLPWPDAESQGLFVAPFGLAADQQNRLWITEPATLDRSATRLLAFDIDRGELVFEHTLADGVARFAQDLRVSPDGRHVVLADTGAFAFTPGQLVVLDIASKQVVRTLRHESLDPQDWVIERFDGEPHRVGWGLLTFQVGVDGISFGPDGRWLYYATMSHDTLYRLPAALLLDPTVDDATVIAAIEPVGAKPLSDGIAVASDGRILITDIEHGGIAAMTPEGALQTLSASDDIIWADSVEVSSDGVVWFTDSAIPAYLQQTLAPPSREVLEAAGPYHLYRFRLPPRS